MTFLDYLCEHCQHEEHDDCWEFEPDPDCVCCAESVQIVGWTP